MRVDVFMGFLNSAVGTLVGVITGAVTAVLQIPYAYYLMGLSMRRAGYNWFSTLVFTATVGTIALLPTLFFIALNSLFTVSLGMKIGWVRGIMGAIKLPFTLYLEFEKRLPLGIMEKHLDLTTTQLKGTRQSLFAQLTKLREAGLNYFTIYDSTTDTFPVYPYEQEALDYLDQYRFQLLIRKALHNGDLIQAQLYSTLLQSAQYNYPTHVPKIVALYNIGRLELLMANAYAQQEITAWQRYNHELTQAMAEYHRLLPPEQPQIAGAPVANPEVAAIKQRNRALLAAIVPSTKPNEIKPLTEEEIRQYQETLSEEQVKESKELEEYIERTKCTITSEAIQKPVTVTSSNGVRHLYEFDALKNWIVTENSRREFGFNGNALPAPCDARNPTTREILSPENSSYGFPEEINAFINRVREAIQPKSQAEDEPLADLVQTENDSTPAESHQKNYGKGTYAGKAFNPPSSGASVIILPETNLDSRF